MIDRDRVWMLLCRDVTDSVSVAGETSMAATLVLDDGTGYILGVHLAPGRDESLDTALEMALATAPPPLSPGPPDAIVTGVGLGDEVLAALSRTIPGGVTAGVGESPDLGEAEEIFDAMIASLIGREPPLEPPSVEGWRALFDAARAYTSERPWERWDEAASLTVEVTVDGGRSEHLALVLGGGGVQTGLGLVPGHLRPPGLRSRTPSADAIPEGTLVCFLDPPGEIPGDLAAKAERYGWPADTDLMPLFARRTSDGLADIDADDAAVLTAGLAAITAHDRRGPVLVDGPVETTGEAGIGDGGVAGFVLRVGLPEEPGSGVDEPEPHDRAGPSINELFAEFLDVQQRRLAERTFRNYRDVIELFGHCLNGYGHNSLSPGERDRWEAAYEAGDEDAFTRLFGADQIADGLQEFLGYFMVRKVMAGEELLRAAGTVTKRLVKWLTEEGHLDAVSGAGATEVARESGRDLPRAERLGRLLHDQALGARYDLAGRRPDELVEDHLVITGVEPGRLWWDDLGPVKVDEAASSLAEVGWSAYVSLVRTGRTWTLAEIGNVYP